MKLNYKIPVVLIVLLLLTACGSSAARLNNRGNTEYDGGEYDEAMDYYRRAQQEDPDLADPYYNSGNTYHRQGNLESAETQLKQANRTAEGELAQHSNYNLGNTYFENQDWEKAVDAYKESLRLNPNDQDAKYNLELALKKLEEQQQQQDQQSGGGGQPPPPNQQEPQEGGGQEPQDQGKNGEQEQPGGGQPQPDESGQSGGNQPDQQQQSGGSRGLTPQEAEQLLDALGQDSQTLQERLQEGYFAPGMPPEKDW